MVDIGGLVVFEYRFTALGGDKGLKTTWWCMWDYHNGLVKVRDLFACCKPGKVSSFVPQFDGITCSQFTRRLSLVMQSGRRSILDFLRCAIMSLGEISQGRVCLNCLSMQRVVLITIVGYWLPYKAARELAKKLCYKIRFALIPIFGLDFPDECLAPGSEGYGKYAIDKSIIEECQAICAAQLTEENKRKEREKEAEKNNPTSTNKRKGRRAPASKVAQVDGNGDTVMMDITTPNTTTSKRKRNVNEDSDSENKFSYALAAGPRNKKQRPEPLTFTPPSSASPFAEHSPPPSNGYRRDRSTSHPSPTLHHNNHHLETPSHTPVGVFDPVRNEFMMPTTTRSSTKRTREESEGMDDIIPGTTRTRRQEIEQLTRNQPAFCPQHSSPPRGNMPSWIGETEAFDYDRNIKQKQMTHEKYAALEKEVKELKNVVGGQNEVIGALKKRLTRLEGTVSGLGGDMEIEEAAQALLGLEGDA